MEKLGRHHLHLESLWHPYWTVLRWLPFLLGHKEKEKFEKILSLLHSVKNLWVGWADLLVHPQIWHLANRKMPLDIWNNIFGIYNMKYTQNLGVLVVAQWKHIQLVSMRMWVQSLALLSGLRIKDQVLLWAVVYITDVAWIPRGCGCGVGRQLQLIWSLVWYFMCHGCGPKNQKKKKKRKGKERIWNNCSFLQCDRCFCYSCWILSFRDIWKCYEMIQCPEFASQ